MAKKPTKAPIPPTSGKGKIFHDPTGMWKVSESIEIEEAKGDGKGKVGKPPDPLGTIAYWKDGIYEKVAQGTKGDWKWQGPADSAHPVGTKQHPDGTIKLNKAAREELAKKGIDPVAYAATATAKNKAAKGSATKEVEKAKEPEPVKKEVPAEKAVPPIPSPAEVELEALKKKLQTVSKILGNLAYSPEASPLNFAVALIAADHNSSEYKKYLPELLTALGPDWKSTFVAQMKVVHGVTIPYPPPLNQGTDADLVAANAEYAGKTIHGIVAPTSINDFKMIARFGSNWRLRFLAIKAKADAEAAAAKAKEKAETDAAFVADVETAVLSVGNWPNTPENLIKALLSIQAGGGSFVADNLTKKLGPGWSGSYLALKGSSFEFPPKSKGTDSELTAAVLNNFGQTDLVNVDLADYGEGSALDISLKMAFGMDWAARFKKIQDTAKDAIEDAKPKTLTGKKLIDAVEKALTDGGFYIPDMKHLVASLVDLANNPTASLASEMEAKFGVGWIDKYAAAKGITDLSASKKDAMVKAVDAAISSAGIGLDAAVAHPEFFAHFTKNFGPNWIEDYKAAKKTKTDELVSDVDKIKTTLQNQGKGHSLASMGVNADINSALAQKHGSDWAEQYIAAVGPTVSKKPALPLLKFVELAGGFGKMDDAQVDQAEKYYGLNWQNDYKKQKMAALGKALTLETHPATAVPFDSARMKLGYAPDSLEAHALAYLYDHKLSRIAAIKKLRDLTGFGLKDSKDAVEKVVANALGAGVLHENPANPDVGGVTLAFGPAPGTKATEISPTTTGGSPAVETPIVVEKKPLPAGAPTKLPVFAGNDPQPLHLFGVDLAKALLTIHKYNHTAIPSAMIKFLGANPLIVAELEYHYGPNWFHTYADAYLLQKVKSLGASQSGWLAQAYGDDWHNKYEKLLSGAPFGTVKAAILKPLGKTAPPPEPIVPSPAAVATTPPPTSSPMSAPTSFSPGEVSDIDKKLPSAISGLAVADSGTAKELIKWIAQNPISSKALAKLHGEGWANAYAFSKWGMDLATVDLTAPNPVKGSLSISTAAKSMDVKIAAVTGTPKTTPHYLLKILKDSPSLETELAAYYSGPGDWKENYFKLRFGVTPSQLEATTPKMKAHGATIVKAVNAMMAQTGLPFSSAAIYYNFTKEYGPKWKSKYLKIAKAPVETPSVSSPGSVASPPVDIDSFFPSNLKLAGDAQHALKGNKPKSFMVDGSGNKFLFKPTPGDKTRATSGAVAAVIAGRLLGPGNYVPVKTMVAPNGEYGSVQPLLPNKGTLATTPLATLTESQLAALVKESVVDWVTSNHDSKAGNFIVTHDGNIIGIDKEQAFKFIGDPGEELGSPHKFNPSPTIYHTLFPLFRSKELNLDPQHALSVIEKVEGISDADWTSMVQPYLDAAETDLGLSAHQKANKLKLILARKNGVRQDFEKLFTKLYRDRGDLGPTETFKFAASSVTPGTPLSLGVVPPKKKKKTPAEVFASIPATPGIPQVSALKVDPNPPSLGGAGKKVMYLDSSGQRFLFRHAIKKGSGEAQPFRVAAQVAVSQMAAKLKPNTVPLGAAEIGGVPGVLQKFVDGKPFGGPDPTKLSKQEMEGVASEHIIDWVFSQHDSHGGNLLKLPDGSVVGIDKEQAFKYFGDDKLDVNYHPNSAYGEKEPYYNEFWRAFSEGEAMDFDPKVLGSYFAKLDAISALEFEQVVTPYAEMYFPGDLAKQSEFVQKAKNRKFTAKHDFEKFVSGLYGKRTGTKGVFTFKKGWVSDGAVEEPKKKKKEPEGPKFEKITKTVSLWADDLGIAIKPHKPKTGTPDPTMLTLKISAGAPASKLTDFLKEMGVSPVGKLVTGSSYHMVFVKKADIYEKEFSKTVEIKPPPPPPVYGGGPVPKVPPHPGKPEYLAAVGAMKAMEPNLGEMDSVVTDKAIGATGKAFMLGGAAVESQSVKIKRIIEGGEEKFLVHFKLRPDTWKAIQGKQTGTKKKDPYSYGPGDATYEWNGGEDGSFDFGSGSYDSSKDAIVSDGSALAPPARVWKDGKSSIALIHNKKYYAFMGGVYAKIAAPKGGSLKDALAGLLNKMKPGLAKEVLKDPTPEEREVKKLAALLWNVAPQTADKLSSSDYTIPTLREKLKAHKIKDDEIDSVIEVEALPGHVSPAIPGRWREIASDGTKTGVKFVMFGASTPDRIVNQLRAGLIGNHERLLSGVGSHVGASEDADVSSGGSDVIMTRVVLSSDYDKDLDITDGRCAGNVSGEYKIIVAPDELDRLDVFFHPGDQYGTTNVDNPSWTSRKGLAAALAAHNKTHNYGELCFKRGISPKKIVRVAAASEAKRAYLIDAFKKAGMTEVNGVPLEDFVIVTTSVRKISDEVLKPLGY